MSFFKEYLKRGKNSKKGFTLVEMIATITILAILSTATVSVVFAVQSTTRHTAQITAEQYSTTQIERFLRNEFQVASDVDVTAIISGAPLGVSDEENREVMYFDDTTNSVHFIRMGENATGALVYSDVLTIESVKQVEMVVTPIKKNPESDDSYKLIYTIETADYTYSGGIVLGNTFYNNSEYHTMEQYGSDTAKIVWTTDTAVTNNNGVCLTFISRVPKSSDTDTH